MENNKQHKSLDAFAAYWIPQVENYIIQMVMPSKASVDGMYGMMRYHLGWENSQGQPEKAPQGKRVRPLVVLLACAAASGEPAKAIPAAAAVELLHNFSLIHDDIEDRSPTRRHRPTLYTLVGEAQAINTGDAMFTLAHMALQGLRNVEVPDHLVLDTRHVFDSACLHLTEGQYLDIGFESSTSVSLADYVTMIAGKTAALLAASAQLGAVVAGSEKADYYWQFGNELGLSFQVQDDILGIWGDEVITGKSAASDILTRKKTLPVLYALSQTGTDADALRTFYTAEQTIAEEDIPLIQSLLERLGAREHAMMVAEAHAEAAMSALENTEGLPGETELMRELAARLLNRNS